MTRKSDCNSIFRSVLCLALVLLPLGLPASAIAQFGPPQVRVAPVAEKEMVGSSTLVGSVRPLTRTTVASEVSGLVTKLDVEEGDRVNEGQVICQLRDTTARLAWKQAVARRQQLEAELAELEAGSRPEEIKQARAAMEEAVAMAQKWEEEYERIEGLRRQGVASLKEYNDTLAEYAAAKQRKIQAEASLQLAVDGPRKEVIRQARHALEAAIAEEQRLKHDLDVTAIRAPFEGYIVQKETEVGQ